MKGSRMGTKVGVMARQNVVVTRGHRLEDRRCDPQLSTYPSISPAAV